jgi:hypothetical protein
MEIDGIDVDRLLHDLDRWYGSYDAISDTAAKVIRALLFKLEAAEKEVTEAENDARQWGKQLDQQVRLNRDDKAKLKELEFRLNSVLGSVRGYLAGELDRSDLAWLTRDGTAVETPSQNCEHDWVNHMSCRKCGAPINALV